MLLTLKEYEAIATKSLMKRKMSITDELIGEAIHALILADIRHKGDNLTGFRSSYIDYMIKTMTTKNRKKREYSDDTSDLNSYQKHDFEFWDFIKSKLPLDRYEMIYDRYKNGLSILDISKKYNISQQWAYQIIRDSITKLRRYKELLC